MIIRPMSPSDYEMVKSIYERGIATGNATFQTTAPEWDEWNNAHLPACRLVAEDGDKVIGWAALTAVSGRCVYAGVAEVSVYIDERSRGKGVGSLLMQALIRESEENGLWTLQAGIFPENEASVQLHLKNGFRQIGFRESIGKMNGVWRNTLLLERRSKIVGTK
jgi:L-amino acid N-acyltransferase YncA